MRKCQLLNFITIKKAKGQLIILVISININQTTFHLIQQKDNFQDKYIQNHCCHTFFFLSFFNYTYLFFKPYPFCLTHLYICKSHYLRCWIFFITKKLSLLIKTALMLYTIVILLNSGNNTQLFRALAHDSQSSCVENF